MSTCAAWFCCVMFSHSVPVKAENRTFLVEHFAVSGVAGQKTSWNFFSSFSFNYSTAFIFVMKYSIQKILIIYLLLGNSNSAAIYHQEMCSSRRCNNKICSALRKVKAQSHTQLCHCWGLHRAQGHLSRASSCYSKLMQSSLNRQHLLCFVSLFLHAAAVAERPALADTHLTRSKMPHERGWVSGFS